MLSLEEIMELLHDRNLNMVARKTGLAYDTVWRVAKGKAKEPSYYTIKKLSEYFQEK